MNNTILTLIIVFLSLKIIKIDCYVPVFEIYSDNPDIHRNTSELIESRGFESETHRMITVDGYILTMFRLINPYMKHKQPLQPVLIQHGLFGNGDYFLFSDHETLLSDGQFIDMKTLNRINCTGLDRHSAGSSIGFVLSACGYDVWLGNFRGNRYSDGHIILNQKIDLEYWSFNIDHHSNYDLPTEINYVLKHTKQPNLIYIGHSMGTTSVLQLLIQRPEYSHYLKPIILLAPVAHVHNIRSPLLLLGAYTPALVKFFEKSNLPLFGLPSRFLALVDQLFATFICGNTLFKPLCALLLFIVNGFDYPNLTPQIIPFAIGHFPDETSMTTLAHWAQRVVHNTFSYYDYGHEKNLIRYGQSIPPAYNLSLIDSKNIMLVSGINDWLANPDDVDILRSQLRERPLKDYVIPFQLWNHADFLVGKNRGQQQNSIILQWLYEFFGGAAHDHHYKII